MGNLSMYFGLSGRLRAIRISTLLAIGVCVFAASGCSDSNRANSAVALGSFPLSSLNQLARVNDNQTDLHDKYLLINFWATWCRPCRKEMPDLQNLSTQLDPENYVVVGVSVDSDRYLLAEFLHNYGIEFMILHDENRQLAETLLGISAYPTTLLISPEGKILQQFSGNRSWDIESIQALFSATSQIWKAPGAVTMHG